jgi:hypothetical protein
MIGVFALLVLLVAFIALAFVVRLGRMRRDDLPESVTWAREHGLVLTASSQPFVAAYLATGRQLRRVCGFGGLVVAASVTAATGIDLHVPGLVWILVGYLVGCFWAEVALTRLPTGTQRTASLVPRRVRDHLPRRMVTAQVVFPAVSFVLAVVAVVLLDDHHSATQPVLTTASFNVTTTAAVLRAGVVGSAVLSVAAMSGVWALQRHLIRRPRPVVAPDLLAADDAMRISSTHLLSGSGLCIVSLLVATQLVCISLATHGPWSALSVIGGLLALLVAWFVFAMWRNRPWQVRELGVSAAVGAAAEPSGR